MNSATRCAMHCLLAAAAVLLVVPASVYAQAGLNPFRPVAWGFLPGDRQWGPTSAVYPDPDGVHIWVAERCGPTDIPDNRGETCLNKDVDPILKFDAAGDVVESFGAGLFVRPHGIHVDHEGNVWVTDAPTGATSDAGRAAGMGHQVMKFSPEGELLLTLGEAGGAEAPGYFFQPNDVLVAPNGDIFVAEGHSNAEGSTARILKFNSAGEFLLAWGEIGRDWGEFMQPHALAMDSRGRLFVGDRSNNRIQIFDQMGNLLSVWHQFGRPSGVYIDANDTIYVADSESNPDWNPGFEQGIRIGDAASGWVTAFILAPNPPTEGGGAEGVAADAEGNVYGAETRTSNAVRRSQALTRYVRIRP